MKDSDILAEKNKQASYLSGTSNVASGAYAHAEGINTKAYGEASHAEGTGSLTLPNPEIIKRYKELGGELITFGSDAHKKEKLLFEYDNISELLKSLNFKYLFKYLEHKPIAVKI